MACEDRETEFMRLVPSKPQKPVRKAKKHGRVVFFGSWKDEEKDAVLRAVPGGSPQWVVRKTGKMQITKNEDGSSRRVVRYRWSAVQPAVDGKILTGSKPNGLKSVYSHSSLEVLIEQILEVCRG